MNVKLRYLLPLVLLLAIVAGRFPGPARPVAAQTPPLAPLPHHVLGLLSKATKVAPAAQATSQAMTVTVVLNRSDQVGFETYLSEVQNPDSPNYRHFLNQRDLASRFGPGQQRYDAVQQYLAANGLSLIQGSSSQLTLTVQGTRAQVEQAFHVQIGDFDFNGRSFFANETNPEVPAALAPSIQAIAGLSNLGRPQPRLAPATGPAVTPATVPAHTPMALAAAYNFGAVTTPTGAAATGSGQKIGLVEYDNFNVSDVQAWITSYGLCTASDFTCINSFLSRLSTVPVNGGTTASGGAGTIEAVLDIDTVMGTAPGANYVVYDSCNTCPSSATWQQMFSAMINDRVTVISNSWGDCEFNYSLAYMQSVDSVLAQAAASGIAVFSASGDSGALCSSTLANGSRYTDSDPGVPDDAPHGTAVGGTTLSVGTAGGYASESWWTSGSYGISCCLNPGGGLSNVYQSAYTTSSYRSVPDVAADADPNTGIYICMNGCGLLYGGTSLAAPIWAGGMALLNQALGVIGDPNAALYRVAAKGGFHSAVSMGSDFSHVGLGSFDLGQLFIALGGGAPVVTGITPTSGTTLGGTLVAITGAGFSTASGVTSVGFGGIAATGVTCSTTSQCQATSPAGSGVVDVRVSVGGQTSAVSSADRFTYIAPPTTCTSVTLSSQPVNTATVGALVKFGASASGCGAPQYAFWLFISGVGWSQTQSYSSTNTWTWNTAGLTAGSQYAVEVWARTQGSTNSYDSWSSLPYSLTVPQGACASAALSGQPVSTASIGAPVKFSASSSGCSSPQYAFWLYTPGVGWSQTQAYSSTTSWTWTTAGLAAGSQYAVEVWVKNQGSTNSYDSWNSVPYALTTAAGACAGGSLSASPASSTAAGSSVTFSVAGVSGCTSPQYEFWLYRPGVGWANMQAYSSSASWQWTTIGETVESGYYVEVWVEKLGGNQASYDSYLSIPYTLK